MKLPVNVGSYIGQKLWNLHQRNEHTRVDNYKEGVCLLCFRKDVVSATVIDICGDCASKRGREALLVAIADKYYGMCYVCGMYKFHIENINARFCMPCYQKIMGRIKEDHHGQEDPFWKSMRKKHGKDWKVAMNDPTKSIRR